MLTKKWMRRSLAMLGALTLTAGLWAAPAMAEEKTYTQPTLNPHVKSIIEVDGYQFIDLNSNGTLDPYEDWRLDADTPHGGLGRADDGARENCADAAPDVPAARRWQDSILPEQVVQ